MCFRYLPGHRKSLVCPHALLPCGSQSKWYMKKAYINKDTEGTNTPTCEKFESSDISADLKQVRKCWRRHQFSDSDQSQFSLDLHQQKQEETCTLQMRHFGIPPCQSGLALEKHWTAAVRVKPWVPQPFKHILKLIQLFCHFTKLLSKLGYQTTTFSPLIWSWGLRGRGWKPSLTVSPESIWSSSTMKQRVNAGTGTLVVAILHPWRILQSCQRVQQHPNQRLAGI